MAGIDTRGIPSHVCINCGSDTFKILVKFDDYEIRLISRAAIKNEDLKAIQLLEQHKYIDISESISELRDQNLVEQYLAKYIETKELHGYEVKEVYYDLAEIEEESDE